MKKILILSGSPHIDGNTNILCKEFAKGAKETGHKVEQINVAQKKIGGCLGCNRCIENQGICVQKDDMVEIRNKILEADAIVLASPVYYYSVCAQLKLVIDRCYAFGYEQLKGKMFYCIITCAASTVEYAEAAIDTLRGFICTVSKSMASYKCW